MKITNKIRFAAITLLLLAGSATQALADDWTGGLYFSGSVYYTSNYTLKLNDVRNKTTGISDSWGASELTSSGNAYGENGAHVFKHAGTSPLYTRCITIGNFWLTKNIPSYSKLVRNVTFNLYLAGTRHHHGCGLYFYDGSEDKSGNTRNDLLDATYLQNYSGDFAGKSHLICRYNSTDRTGTSEKKSVNYSWNYDNSNNSDGRDWTKVITFVHASGCENEARDGLEWASWVENSVKETWYYYKHITFDANGGTGTTMTVQTIENSGKLTKNTYTRTGYRLAGWNTQPDGSGTAYYDEGTIVASSTDKGPVTLYAQWREEDWVEDKFYQATFTYGTVGYKSPIDLDPSLTPGNDYSNAWGMKTLFANDHYEIFGKGTATSGTMSVSMATYYYSIFIPSYSKLVRNVVFDFMMGNNKLLHGCGLYVGDDYDVLKEATFDAQADQSGKGTEHGIDYLVYKTYNQANNGGLNEKSDSKSLAYDNKSGSTDKTLTKYAVFVHSVGNKGKNPTYDKVTHWAGWNEDLSQTTETWYYYKHFTFKKNDGTDTQVGDVVTIENSGTLSFPETPTLTGYKFVGWNTQADGKGTTYTNGQEIIATLEDKGPVTLYAQWAVDVTVSESGSATVFADKNLVVPEGVQVYGFVYMDGALVQGTEISKGAILPANNGYLVKATTAGTYTFVPTGATATAPTSDLTGTMTEINTPSGDVYVWGKPKGYNYGWYKYTGEKIPAGKAYYIKQQ